MPAEIRGVLIPVAGVRLLLPNAVVAEVITLPTLQPFEDALPGVLGRIAWRGWSLPLVQFAVAAGLAPSDHALYSRGVVLKALGGHAGMSFLALVTQGFPRLVTVSEAGIGRADGDMPRSDLVLEQVQVHDETALIPDLDALERRLAASLG